MNKILVASKNKGKIAEIQAALAILPITLCSLQEYPVITEPEETEDTFRDNAILKAEYYFKKTKMACIADDSGLEVDYLAGQPGVRSARYAGEKASDAANNDKLLVALDSVPASKRTARFRCVIAFIDELGSVVTVNGSCEGMILTSPRGIGGFGYDPLLFLPELGKTMAELTIEEKNSISHRGQAIRRMADLLQERFR